MKYLRTAKGCTRANHIRKKGVRKDLNIFSVREK